MWRGVCFSNVTILLVRNSLLIFILWVREGSSVQSLQKFVCTFINSKQNCVSGVWQGRLSHYFKFLFKKQRQSQLTTQCLHLTYIDLHHFPAICRIAHFPLSPVPWWDSVPKEMGIYDSHRFLICHQNAAVSEKLCYLFQIPADLLTNIDLQMKATMCL